MIYHFLNSSNKQLNKQKYCLVAKFQSNQVHSQLKVNRQNLLNT